MAKLKIALVQDQLLTQAGSERVFLQMCEAFPDADIFTLCYNPKGTWPEFSGLTIRQHPLGRFIKSHKLFKLAFPLSTYLMQFWNFNQYDIVLTSSATTAKYIRRFTGKHFCYCYFPTRALWNAQAYFGVPTSFVQKTLAATVKLLQKRDLAAARRVDHFIAISAITKKAIKDIYGRDSEVIWSPIVLRKQNVKGLSGDYFLLVSRLEVWKNVDLAINAFNISGEKLIVVGVGPEGSRLKSLARENIEFRGSVSDLELASLYSGARAVIFTPELEYGLVPIEAAAYGTISVAFGVGGVLETMVDEANRDMAVFFEEPTADSLLNAIGRIDECNIKADDLILHASKFSPDIFRAKLRQYVTSKWESNGE